LGPRIERGKGRNPEMANAYSINSFLPLSFSGLETIKTDSYFKLVTRFPACGIRISRISCQTVVSEGIPVAVNAEVEKPPSLQRLLRRADGCAMEISFS